MASILESLWIHATALALGIYSLKLGGGGEPAQAQGQGVLGCFYPRRQGKGFGNIDARHFAKAGFRILCHPQDEGADIRHGGDLKIPLGEHGLLGRIEEFSAVSFLQVSDSFCQILQGLTKQKTFDILSAQGVLLGGLDTGKTHANQAHIFWLLFSDIAGDGSGIDKAAA